MAITGCPVVPALRSSACVCVIASGRGPYPAGLRRPGHRPPAPAVYDRAPMTTIGLSIRARWAPPSARRSSPPRATRWASEDRSAASADRAAAAGLGDAGTASALRERSDVLLSICPPHAALDVAGQVTGYRGVFVDCNAIAPATARDVAAVVEDGGAAYVDGGIVGPPPANGRSARLYLSGARAAEVAVLFAGTPVDARVVGPEVTAASALKMAYAAWTKGPPRCCWPHATRRRALGSGTRSRPSGAQSLPDLPARAERAEADAPRRAGAGWARWRRSRALADAGLPDGFHRAAAEMFAREREHQGHEAVRHQPPRPPGLPVEPCRTSTSRSSGTSTRSTR